MGSASCNLIFVSLVQNHEILIFSHNLSSNISGKSSTTMTRRHKKIELIYHGLNWTYRQSVILLSLDWKHGLLDFRPTLNQIEKMKKNQTPEA